jgi:hypothetical protein
MLSDEGLISAHRHQWILIHCGGNGICGGTGPGRSLAAAANSEEIAKLIEVTHRFGEVEFRDKLLRTLFDLRTTRAVQYLTIRVPEHGFADRSEFRAWIAHEAIEFDDTVGRMQRERR